MYTNRQGTRIEYVTDDRRGDRRLAYSLKWTSDDRREKHKGPQSAVAHLGEYTLEGARPPPPPDSGERMRVVFAESIPTALQLKVCQCFIHLGMAYAYEVSAVFISIPSPCSQCCRN